MRTIKLTLSIIILFISFSAVKAQSSLPRVTFTFTTTSDTLFVGLKTNADSTLVYFYREDSLGNAIDTLMQTLTKYTKNFSIPMISKRVTIAGEISYLVNEAKTYRDFYNIISVDASNHTTLSELKLFSLPPVNETLSVDISNCLALRYLDLFNNNLTFQSLKYDGCTNLETFVIIGNPLLDSLDVSFCVSLKYLTAYDNYFKYVKLNDSIERVNCKNNQLTHLQVEGLQKLKTLNIEDNLFTSFELIDNPSLQALWISNNQLQHLKVDNLPKMLQLLISNNLLTGLDIRGDTSLHTIECYGNPLSSCALDSLFKILPDWNGWIQGHIYIANDTIECLGSSSCHSDIATARNWKVLNKKGSSTYTGDGSGCCSHIMAFGLQASNITTHSAQISWIDTSFHSSWEISIQKENAPAGTKLVYNNPYILSNLSPQTTYHVSLRAVCPDGSLWSDTLTFSTKMDIGITNIVFPTPDSCHHAGSSISLQLTLFNQSQNEFTNLGIYANIDSAGQIIAHLQDNIPALSVGEIIPFTFNIPYNAPHVSDYMIKVYIDAAAGDNNRTNDTISNWACVDNVSIKESSASAAGVMLSPNPCIDRIDLEIKDINLQSAILEIYDIHGKLLHTQHITNRTTPIDFSSYAEGMYFFKLKNNRQTIKTIKVIKNQ
ncbi:MAG: T9SS type A sorting domain-containing protein [Bacteroidales bacterium]|nr:T9SS type A sorting domain-containing protein [Bacteroidales bacterium]